jgi:hypothetical protein
MHILCGIYPCLNAKKSSPQTVYSPKNPLSVRLMQPLAVSCGCLLLLPVFLYRAQVLGVSRVPKELFLCFDSMKV